MHSEPSHQNIAAVFDARAIDILRGIFAEVCADAQATLVAMDGEDDHVHLLIHEQLKWRRRFSGFSGSIRTAWMPSARKGPRCCRGSRTATGA